MIRDLVIDFEKYQVTIEGRSVPLTPTEFRLLAVLAQQAGRVVDPRALLSAVHQHDYSERDAQNLVKQIARAARFFAHESCAQCTQCREGTAWTTKILERIEAGGGTMQDFDTLLELADNMTGKTICVLSDSCATPVVSGLTKFRADFEAAEATRETDPVSLHLDSPYQISKIIGEFYGNYYFARHGVPFVKARFQNVYGPGEILGAGQWRGSKGLVCRRFRSALGSRCARLRARGAR